ncbi:QcrA and Rieske domain-containing protein [Bythopirellula polymerisocia]|uniref:Cytochrome b6-f complex iron-sulfur subunit n=1 Tax=Bythopirellula polymerisocia TaxID=2528003 RepID=A0A5C6CJV6_9BACT|nr:ubiquinol-cytochrome c reductase iron-sulfur subunit [Bythopirellula polymerisocia]TWU23571.1 Cytochrome b6-f complex iron-sulfur subunit [Bythopirellula polymerisocia]
MAEKKKMSVAEMLAAARKADGGDGASSAEPAEAPPAEAAAEPTQAKSPEPKSGNPAPAKAADGGRMSVAEMLAAARGGGGGAAAAKPAEKKPAPKPAAEKAKPVAAKKQAEASPSEPRDTASILAAAKKSSKAGPTSKAEAAAKEKADPVPKAKPQIVVPPMPAKPAYAKGKAAAKPKEPADETRRGFLNMGFWLLTAVGALWSLATLKFMFPNVRREPPSKFKVGFPDAFPSGQVQTKFKAQFGVWVVNTEVNGHPEIFALKSVCTHLGCTPNWLEAEQKFKCPCHGSGFYKDGINFEGPAPRPLERYAIRVADDGQIEIDKSQTFQEEMGQWEEPSSFIPV